MLFYVAFLIIETVWGKIGSLKEDKKAIARMERGRGSAVIYLLGMLASISGLVISSKYLVMSAITISKSIGVEEEIIGLSMVAIGTSLPELATTIMSGIKKDWKLLYGDIQGSNIYNLSIIGALLISFGKSGYFIDSFSLAFMFITTMAIIVLSNKFEGRSIPRSFGIAFLVIYAIYILKIYFQSEVQILH